VANKPGTQAVTGISPTESPITCTRNKAVMIPNQSIDIHSARSAGPGRNHVYVYVSDNQTNTPAPWEPCLPMFHCLAIELVVDLEPATDLALTIPYFEGRWRRKAEFFQAAATAPAYRGNAPWRQNSAYVITVRRYDLETKAPAALGYRKPFGVGWWWRLGQCDRTGIPLIDQLGRALPPQADGWTNAAST